MRLRNVKRIMDQSGVITCSTLTYVRLDDLIDHRYIEGREDVQIA